MQAGYNEDDRGSLLRHEIPPHRQYDPLGDARPASARPVVYTRRWYILAVFCLQTFTQALIWNTWGPIAASAELAFGWDDGIVALLTNWGPIMFCLSTIFMAWLMDVKGLRWACSINACLILVGAGLRCITSSPQTATWLIHVGQAVNGIAGPICQAGPPLLSATWFPANQRTTATALGAAFAGFGVAVSFLLGPNLVPDVRQPTNATNVSDVTATPFNNITNATDSTIIRKAIMEVMYIEFGLAAAAFLLVLVYFPAKPPTAPSKSATMERMDFKNGLKRLVRHKQFWNLGSVYAIASGVGIAWATVLDINLKPLGVKELTAGMIGFYGTIATQVLAVAVGLSSDIFAKKMKLFLIALFVVGGVMVTLFALVCINVIPFKTALLYVFGIIGGAAINSTIPLFFELVCEAAYPIAEGITNGFLTWLNNFSSLIFYFILMAPIGTAWMNWCYVGAIFICLPILMVYKETYSRLNVDTTNEETNSPDIIDPAV